MATEIRTEIRIKATPEKVWKLFIDYKNYPKWNPFIKSVEGNVAVGNKIVARIQAPDSKEMVFKPIVLTYSANKELRWLGHLLFPGLFDGEHRFQLIDNLDGTTTFIQSEKFTGILVPLFKKMLDNNTRRGFILMNEKLKALSEANNL